MTKTSDAARHHLRADAERNRRRLLDAAAVAFAEHGLDVSVAEIARAAGVGQGTVFRRFPTKDHLVAAIITDRLDDLIQRGEGLLGAEDPAHALYEFLTAGAQSHSENRGLFQAVGAANINTPEVRAAHSALLDAADRLVARAQEQGSVRGDVTGTDIVLLQGAICQAAMKLHNQAPDMWRRYATLVFDSLRPEGAHPMDQPPPTRKQMERAFDDAHAPLRR